MRYSTFLSILVVVSLFIVAIQGDDAASVDSKDPRCIRGELPNLYALEKPLIKDGVPVIEVPSNMTQFYLDYIVPNKPAIIRGIVDKWPAFKKWKNDAYLKKKIGGMQVSVEMSRSNQFGYEVPGGDWRERIMPMSKFLSLYSRPERKVNFYVSNDVPESLYGDVEIPKFVPCANDLANQYEAPFYTDFGMWFGGGGQVSLLHNDPEDNLLMIVDGRKQIYVFPPHEGPFIYEKTPGFNGLPSVDAYLGEDSSDGDLEPSSRVSPVDITKPDYDKYPLLREAQGYEIILEAGDVLFLPKFWWHQVHSYCRNLAVNYWFDLHDLRASIVKDKKLLVAPSGDIVTHLSPKDTSCPSFERTMGRKAKASSRSAPIKDDL